jgi:hypothetical protein
MSDPDLTIEQKIQECRAVIKDFKYFLDKYVYWESKETNSAIKLHLWPSQEEVVPKFLSAKLLISLKARQLGISWLAASYVLWKAITCQLHLSVIISATEELSIEFLDRVYFIMDRLPAWLKPPTRTRTKQVFEFQHANNLVSTIKSLPNTEAGAQSKTPNILVMDESCLSKLSRSIFNSSYPGIEQAKGQVIVISNSIKEGAGWAWTRSVYLGSMKGANNFERVFLPWNAHPGRPETFRQDMLAAGMSEREVSEHYPETEQEAVEDRNIKGVYYAKQMMEARKDKRICTVPWVPGHEVYTFWDLGVDDSMSIGFMQQVGLQFRFIDYYENSGMGLTHYAKILKEKPYVYGDHYMPHDAAKRELGGDTDVALSRKETAENLGIDPILIVKRPKDTQAVLNGIESVRNILAQCVFDEFKCDKLIGCLESYRSEWDEDNQKLDNKPLHDWSAHGADMMRVFATGYQAKVQTMPYEKVRRDYAAAGGLGYLGS